MTNSRFEDLERRCQRLRRKRIATIVFLCTFLMALGFVYFYSVFLNQPQHESIKAHEPATSHLEPQKENNLTQKNDKVVETNTTLTVEAKEEQNQTNTAISHTETPTENSYDTLLLSAKLKKNNSKVPVEEKIELAPPLKSGNPSSPLVIEDFLSKPDAKKPLSMNVTTLSNEEALLKNFHSSKAFAEALALAHFYFDRKEYIKAIFWSKESSKLKPVSDEPWIIYAKSKFHTGEREEAIRSLELFLGYVNSKDVKELLTFYKGQQ